MESLLIDSVIYDAIGSGTGMDNANTGAVIVVVMLTGLTVYVALVRRTSHLQGRPFRSKSPIAVAIWTWVGEQSILPIVIACVLCLGISMPLVVRYIHDKRLLNRGDYSRWSGAVSRYTTTAVSSRNTSRFAKVAGQPSTSHERDRLTVEGRVFFVQCDLPPEKPAGVVGGAGQCLRLQAGQQVEVDYVQTSPTTYRGEPLKIRLIEP